MNLVNVFAPMVDETRIKLHKTIFYDEKICWLEKKKFGKICSIQSTKPSNAVNFQ